MTSLSNYALARVLRSRERNPPELRITIIDGERARSFLFGVSSPNTHTNSPIHFLHSFNRVCTVGTKCMGTPACFNADDIFSVFFLRSAQLIRQHKANTWHATTKKCEPHIDRRKKLYQIDGNWARKRAIELSFSPGLFIYMLAYFE